MVKKIQSYNLIDRIGIGGMGIVWKASHEYRAGFFAIKSLSPQFVHDADFRKRFLNEAAILNKLNHKNIVKIADFIEEPEGLHLVMEFVEGRTLDKIIGKEVGPIPYERALPLFNQILDGINYAHKQGVIHRDLKPSNIIVTPNNEIKITDFGIARMEGQGLHTKTGTKMGTLFYMSPEQIKGEYVDEQADIYSLGITLYVMLAGKLPFENTENMSDFALMNKIVNEPVKDPRDYYPAIPEWLVEIVYKAIEKDKTKRIKTIEEFIKHLNNKGENLNFDIEMVYVEGGSIKMVSNGRNDRKNPIEWIKVSSFYISKYQITQKQWQQVMGYNPSYFKGGNLPVENVSWNDVQEFIKKLNQLTGKKYRLPTAAEWEYAARGGNKSKGFKYAGSNNIDDVSWYKDNSIDKTHPVGTKKPNELGIYDMSGNVWELCKHDEYYFFDKSQPIVSFQKYLKGGSWDFSAEYCKNNSLMMVFPDASSHNIGFRLISSE